MGFYSVDEDGDGNQALALECGYKLAKVGLFGDHMFPVEA